MTSIEWLVAKIEKHDKEFSSFYGAEITEAMQMEKQQHGETWDEALRIFESRGHNFLRAWEDFDEWYEKLLKQD